MVSILIYNYKESNLDKEYTDPTNVYSDQYENESYNILLFYLKKKFDKVYIKISKTRKSTIGRTFYRVYEYASENKFKYLEGPIKVNFIFDRSGEVKFPKKYKNICNTYSIRSSFRDKLWVSKYLKNYHPVTFLLHKNFDKNILKNRFSKLIAKPRFGAAGKSIKVVESYQDIIKIQKLATQNKEQFILQEFKDTSKGVPQIINTKHDLRVQYCNNRPVLSYWRSPKKGRNVSNYSQGGQIGSFSYQTLSRKQKKFLEEISNKISKDFPNSHYSIDFGIDKRGKPFLFELNTNMGWPGHPNGDKGQIHKWANTLSEMLYKTAVE